MPDDDFIESVFTKATFLKLEFCQSLWVTGILTYLCIHEHPQNPRDNRSSSDTSFDTGQDDLSPDSGDD